MDPIRAFFSRRLVLAVGVMLAAFTCGHLMQTGMLSRSAAVETAPDAASVIRDATRAPRLPVPPAATLKPRDLSPPQITPQGTFTDSALTPDLRQDFNVSPFGLPCDETLTVTHTPPATLDLTLSAPCRPGEEVRLRHNVLTITERTDDFGTLRLSLPALSFKGDVQITFADNTRVQAAAMVADLHQYTRVALVWTGGKTFGLRALEPSAREVSTAAPGTPARALRGAGGYLSMLGQEMRAAIYTYPSASSLGGNVRFVLDAMVTADDCGRQIEATAHQNGAIGGLMSRVISVDVPDCSAVGQTLTLDSPFRDMRVARR